MNREKENHGTGRWLVFSAVIHLFVLAAMSHWMDSGSMEPIREGVIRVALVTLPSDPPARQSVAVDRHRRPKRPKDLKDGRYRREPDRSAKAEPIPPPPDPAVPERAATTEPAVFSFRYRPERLGDSGTETAVEASVERMSPSDTAVPIPAGYLSEVRMRIERAKRYPWSARVRGLEGTSLVSFRILANGTVREVGIRRSSSFSILDEAAVRTVERAAPFPALPSEVSAENVEIHIPMVFELH